MFYEALKYKVTSDLDFVIMFMFTTVYIYIYIYILSNSFTQAGCDTRSIFKWC